MSLALKMQQSFSSYCKGRGQREVLPMNDKEKYYLLVRIVVKIRNICVAFSIESRGSRNYYCNKYNLHLKADSTAIKSQ